MNWHNEVLREQGWFTEDEEKVNYEEVEKTPANYCKICGTRTGLHGFSFGRKVV